MPEKTIQEWLDQVPNFMIPDKAAGIDAIIQLNLSGDQGGNWYVQIKDKKAQVFTGTAPNPRLTVTADSQDALQLLDGRMDPMKAFMQGKVKVTGDMGFAMTLFNLYRG